MVILWLCPLVIFGLSAGVHCTKIPITSCQASSEKEGNTYAACEYAYEDPDISSWRIEGTNVHDAWIILYFSESDVSSFSYRHRYGHGHDDCSSCLIHDANKDIRVTLSSGHYEDFTLQQVDGNQHFSFSYEVPGVTWVNIQVLSVYGEQHDNGASEIQVFSNDTFSLVPTLVPTSQSELSTMADYVVDEIQYEGSYFDGDYESLASTYLTDDSAIT